MTGDDNELFLIEKFIAPASLNSVHRSQAHVRFTPKADVARRAPVVVVVARLQRLARRRAELSCWLARALC
jgi:hypothetical protein